MKIFNFIKTSGDETVCIPITAPSLQQAYESFFVTEGYKIKIDTIQNTMITIYHFKKNKK